MNLELRIQSLDMQDRIYQVIIPTEEEIAFKDGKRKSERKKVFPGYILVQMKMDDESWYAVRTTPGDRQMASLVVHTNLVGTKHRVRVPIPV